MSHSEASVVSSGVISAQDRDKGRLEKIERTLSRLEAKLDQVSIKPPKGMPIDVVLGAQW